MQQPCREPIEFAAGDTLSFTRSLSDYPASQGWSLIYELRGGTQPIEFTSTASGDSHVLSVTSAVTSTWMPGDYVLAGYAVSASERHQIYNADLPVSTNLQAAPGDEIITTHAQRMLALIEKVLEAKIDGGDLAMSRIGETEFKYLSFDELYRLRGIYAQERRQEIAKERAKAGMPTGSKIRPIMRVQSPGPSVGMSYRGGYGGW